jgi:hypothetical protein
MRSALAIGRGLAALSIVLASGCGQRAVTVATASAVDPCEATPVRPVEELLGGSAVHQPVSAAVFGVAGSTKGIPAQQCVFRLDVHADTAEVVVRIADGRAKEFMEKLPKDRLAPLADLGADEAYWHYGGQAVFVRKDDRLLGVHVSREDGLDRAPAIQQLARTMAAAL